MSKETIPQSIIDKINEKYPESNSNSNQGLSEGRIKELYETIGERNNEIYNLKLIIDELNPKPPKDI